MEITNLNMPSWTAFLPSGSSLVLPSLLLLSPLSLSSYSFVPETSLSSIALSVHSIAIWSTEVLANETITPWWTIAECLEPHGLPGSTILAPAPPPILLLSSFPDRNNQSGSVSTALMAAISPLPMISSGKSQ